MNTRSMSAPRRVDTRWPQTEQMSRRAMRSVDNPYRRSRARLSWGKILDAICWAIVVTSISFGGAWVLAYTIKRLGSIWL